MAYIDNSKSYTLVNGTDDNDHIYNNGHNVTIESGAGNNYITNSGYDVTIDGGAGNDYITNNGDEVSIDSGAGNDTIGNGVVDNDNTYGDYSIIDGGDDDDYIFNICPESTLKGGAGNDSIFNRVETEEVYIEYDSQNDDPIYEDEDGYYETNYYVPYNVSIEGGDGDDYISNEAEQVTINSGTGNDTIRLSSGAEINLIIYETGNGNDSIVGFNEDDTLSISGGSYTTQKSGNDILISVGDNVIKLENAYLNSNVFHINDETIKFEPEIIKLTNGGDSISNYRNGTTIIGGTGKDSISN